MHLLLFFLHHYEGRLNGRIRSFLLREGLDRYDPDRFLDYKMGCVLAMLERLPDYDPDKGADFLTYVHHHVGNALLTCRMREEGGSFSSLDEYKAVRGIAWLYNEHESEQEAIARYAEQNGCSEKIAAAVYEYQVDYDGEWGEISFDFVQGTAEIVKLAELDMVKSNLYANAAICEIISMPEDARQKHFIVTI